ncbi:ERVV1 protein, partial [Bucorvus abyssinicus]|nr:ERVV1 protein [Bucorvus abyssinicus]
LASSGGVCAVINSSCCSYIDQSNHVNTDLEEIWKQVKILHEVMKDDTSWGFEEIWNKLTSWLPNFTGLKHVVVTVLGIEILLFATCAMIRCSFWCCKRSIENYDGWKRNKMKHQVETGKYFEKL